MSREPFRTPIYGYWDDEPCEDCGAPGGTRCRIECPTGLGELGPERTAAAEAARRASPAARAAGTANLF